MDNPFNKDREGIQNRLHNLFEEFKGLDDSEKLLRIYSEVLQANNQQEIDLDALHEHLSEQEEPEWEEEMDQLSLKELVYVLYNSAILEHLTDEMNLTKEEVALLFGMITGHSHKSMRQLFSEDWTKLTPSKDDDSIKAIYNKLWRKTAGHKSTKSLIRKIDPFATDKWLKDTE